MYIRHRFHFGCTLCIAINPKVIQMRSQSEASVIHIAFISAGHLRVASTNDALTQIVNDVF